MAHSQLPGSLPHLSTAARNYLNRCAERQPIEWPDPYDLRAWSALVDRLNADMTGFYKRYNTGFLSDVHTHALSYCSVFEVRPSDWAGDTVQRSARCEETRAAVLLVHGGAYVMGGGELAAEAAFEWSHALGRSVAVYSVDYRLPPEHVFPAALDDVVEALDWVMERHADVPIAAIGVSAGGGLLASAFLRRRDEARPIPMASVLFMPECDLTESGDSFNVLHDADVVLRGSLSNANRFYAGSADLSHPYISAVYGDVTGAFPPTLLVSGTRDLFLSNAVRLHSLLEKAGIEVSLSVHEAMPHGGLPGTREHEMLVSGQVSFLRRYLMV